MAPPIGAHLAPRSTMLNPLLPASFHSIAVDAALVCLASQFFA